MNAMPRFMWFFAVVLMGTGLFPAMGHAAGEPYEVMADHFFDQLTAGQVDAAFDTIFAGSPMARQTDKVDYIKKQTEVGLGLYGDVLEYEHILTKDYGTSLVRLAYLVKTARMPLCFEIYFYQPKPDQGWFVVKLNFNDQFDLVTDY